MVDCQSLYLVKNVLCKKGFGKTIFGQKYYLVIKKLLVKKPFLVKNNLVENFYRGVI